MKNLLVCLALLLTIPVASAETVDYTKQDKLVVIERCIGGVLYYVASEWRYTGNIGLGFGYMAPKIDPVTLEFLRCRKEDQ